MFFRNLNVSFIHSDELRCAVYLWSQEDMLDVANMSRRVLIDKHTIIRKMQPWPHVRKTVSWTPHGQAPIEMDLDDVDIANRKLHLLLALYERKRKCGFMSRAAALKAGTYNAEGPLMLRIYGPGGIAALAPRSTAAGSGLIRTLAAGVGRTDVDLDEVADVGNESAGVQDSVIDRASGAQDSESDRAPTDSDDEESQALAARASARLSRVWSRPLQQTRISETTKTTSTPAPMLIR
jgi:hypothetical protein